MSSEPHEATGEAEATGETVGEAKWAAARELERRFPGLDKSTVEYVVLSEGERGLLGVGFIPARVIGRVAAQTTPPTPERPQAALSSLSPPSMRLLEFLEQVRTALGVDASVTVREEGETSIGAFSGRDVGLLIGKRGQTIDAIEYLANAVVSRGEQERIHVTVDAAGYRSRRRVALEGLADRVAEQVVSTGRASPLEPMSSPERKIVHLYLDQRSDVVTSSEGDEPARYVVVRPTE